MAVLETLWAGMLTRDEEDSGTDSSIVLIINERGGDPDLLHHTFPDTAQRDQETGQANVYQITKDEIKAPLGESPLFSADQLNDSSIRVGIRGDDAWRPDTFWSTGQEPPDLREIGQVLGHRGRLCLSSYSCSCCIPDRSGRC